MANEHEVAYPVGVPLSHAPTRMEFVDRPGVPVPPPVVIPDHPVVTSLEPNTAVAGSAPDITMVVNGTGFDKTSVITFNGLDEPTTLISPTQVSTGVKPSLFVVPATCPVAVRNGRRTSNQMPFTFTGPVP